VNIKLHIERLVLDDVNIRSEERHSLLASLETELSRLLSDGGMSTPLALGPGLHRISASGFEFTADNPTQLGRKIAQSVYGGIGHE